MDKNQINKILESLKSGGVIAYPTDTLYGIGSDATNQDAIKKIFEIKGRDFSKPLSIACSSIDMIKKYADVSFDIEKMLQKILPGPYTVLLPKKDSISNLLTAGSNLVGVRIPDHILILEIIKQFGKPIVTTSANLSGRPDIVNLEDIGLLVDYVVQGDCKYNRPSTIFNPTSKEILREGANVEEIYQILGE